MRRVVISSFLTLVILALVAAAYFYFQRYSIVSTDPVNAVPANAVFFIEAKGTKNILKKLSAENLWSSILSSDSTADNNLKLFDSAMSSNDAAKETWENKTIFLSAHLTKANSIDYLYVTNVPSEWSDEKNERFISDAFHTTSPFSKRVYENVTVHELTVSPDQHFSFAVSKGVFIGSFTSFLIDDAIRQLKSGTSVSKSKAFTKILKKSDAKTAATVYINYISLREFFTAFTSGGNTELINGIGSFARWSKLDATILHNGLLFHGLSSSVDTADFISSLNGQQPQRIDMTEIIPARTALFIHIGLSDYSKYYHHLLSNSVYFDPENKRKETIRAIGKKFDVDLEKNLTGWIDNEIALVVTESGSSAFGNSCYACIKAKDIEQASASLLQIQTVVNKNSGAGKPEEYRKHTLGFINLTGLVPLFYSNLFSNVNKFYFTSAGKYIVIANQAAALRSFIDDFEDDKTLSDEAAFKNVSRNAERSSNFYLYVNLVRAKNIFRHYASDDLNARIDKNRTLLNTFSSFTFQLMNRNDVFATTAQFLQATEKVNDANLLWSTQLDTLVTMAPFILTNAETKDKFIMVQDEGNMLYMIDDAGNIAWKKPLPEKIISGFHIVDANRNGQQQILFNTASQLYQLDLTGNDYGNFPIHLPALATNGCEVFDFDGSKNYKIFIACKNRMIYTYEISGKPMSGWLFNQPVSEVTKPIQNFKVLDKDYILIHNSNGAVFLLDKKGTIRLALKQTYIGKNSTFSLMPGDSADAAHLVTTDTTGRILNIYFNGTVKSKSYLPMSSDHAFTLADADGDGKPDYVFLDHHQLNVMRDDSSLIYYHIFIEDILPEIHAFSFTSSLQQLGFASSSDNKFYLVNKDGKIANGFPVKGFTGITSNDWGTDGKRILITSGTDGTVYTYNLE